MCLWSVAWDRPCAGHATGMAMTVYSGRDGYNRCRDLRVVYAASGVKRHLPAIEPQSVILSEQPARCEGIADSAVNYAYLPAPTCQSCTNRLREGIAHDFRAASTSAPPNREPSLGHRATHAAPRAVAHRRCNGHHSTLFSLHDVQRRLPKPFTCGSLTCAAKPLQPGHRRSRAGPPD